MKKIYPLLCLMSLVFSEATAQVQYDYCHGARTLCNKAPVTVTRLTYPSPGFDLPPFCFGSPIRQPYWFHFNPVTSGTIEFIIFPEIPGAADFDFALYDGCPPGGELVCDWAGPRAPTGVTSNPNEFWPLSGFGPGIQPFPITVEAGVDYYLLVDNYSSNGVGFTIEFSGSFQIAETDPVDYPVENALSCTNAPLFDCECLNGFSSGTRLWDGNQNFYRFEACACAMEFTITIDGPCVSGNAIQAQILNYNPATGNCSPTPLPFSGEGYQGSPCEITAYNLQIGQEYVLAINGFNGASCPYTIEVTPLAIPAPQVDTIFTAPAVYCEGDTIAFVVAQNSAVLTCYCHWTVPPGADTLQPAPNTLLVLAGHGDGLPHQVCVAASNGCNEFITICREITIFPDTTIELSALICQNDLPFLFNGQALNAAGTYFDTLQRTTGCDSIFRFHLFVQVCEDGAIQGNSDVCPEQVATYTLTPPTCSMNAPGGDCTDPVCDCELCEAETGIDSLLYLWHIPDCARFLGDSTGLEVTLVFDQCIFQTDTTVTDSIWVEIIPVYVHPDSLPADTSNCNCYQNGPLCGAGIPVFPVYIYLNTVSVTLNLLCSGPPVEFMGVFYDTPGTYSQYDATDCTLYTVWVTYPLSPIADAGPDQLLCFENNPVQLQAGFFNPHYEYVWSNGATGPATSVMQLAATIITYGLTVTDPATGCSATDEVTVNVAPAVLTFLPPVWICPGECFDFGGQTVCPQPGDPPLFVPLPSQLFCDSTVTQEVFFVQPDTTDLGVVATLTCAQPQVEFNGTLYDAVGTYLIQTGACQYERISIDASLAPPIADAGPDQLICLEDNPVQLQAQQVNPDYLYVWSTGATGPATTTTQPAATTVTYGLTVTDPATGCSATAEVTVNVAPAILTFLPPVWICLGECFDFGGQTVCPQPGDPPLFVTLPSQQFCDSTITLEVFFVQPDTTDLGVVATLTCAQPQVEFNGTLYDAVGTYLIQTGACQYERISIDASLAPPIADAGPDQLICLEDNPVQLQAQQVNPDYLYVWSTGATGPATTVEQAAPTIVTYGLTVTDPATGCSATDEVTVNVAAAQVTFLSPVWICPGECFDFGGQLVCPGPDDIYLQTLVPSTFVCDSILVQQVHFLQADTTDLGLVGALTCAQPQVVFRGIAYEQPGEYLVHPDACTFERFHIAADTAVPMPVNVETACIPFSGQYRVLVQLPAGETWRIGGVEVSDTTYGSDPILSGEPYSLLFENVRNGCVGEFSGVAECIPDISLYLPNVIHPASGAPNGYLTVYAPEGQVAQVNSLQVFDRWGGAVFARSGFAANVPELGWDGTARGKACPEGVYVYVCEVQLADGNVEKRTGDVTVLR